MFIHYKIINIYGALFGFILDFRVASPNTVSRNVIMVIGELNMSERPGRSSGVIGPAGQPLTVESLPPENTVRWVIRRKAEVVSAVRNGLIGLDEACERYRLSVDEFLNWEQLIEAHGLRGLRVTRIQDYRQPTRGEAVVRVLSEKQIDRGESES